MRQGVKGAFIETSKFSFFSMDNPKFLFEPILMSKLDLKKLVSVFTGDAFKLKKPNNNNKEFMLKFYSKRKSGPRINYFIIC